MSAKKKIIKITFGAAAIMMLLSGRNTAKVSAQTVSEDGERYRIEQNEEDGKRYLTDRHGQTVAGCKMVWREDFPLMPGAYWQ